MNIKPIEEKRDFVFSHPPILATDTVDMERPALCFRIVSADFRVGLNCQRRALGNRGKSLCRHLQYEHRFWRNLDHRPGRCRLHGNE